MDDRVSILVVDDEPDNLELLARSLRIGTKLFVAKTAEEARAILTENSIDTVVTDHRLPGEDGASLLRWVASNFPKVARMLVTAYGDSPAVVEACNDGSVEQFFIKPYSPMALKGAVLNLLRARGRLSGPRILVADDEEDVRSLVRAFLEKKGFDIVEAEGGRAAIKLFDAGGLDTALLDVGMPDINGLGVLEHIVSKDPTFPVIILTASEAAIGLSLIEAGAFDFLGKPFRAPELVMRVQRAVVAQQQAREHKRLLSEASREEDDTIVAESAAMRKVIDMAANVAKHDVTVLLQGETGTGKEVLAAFVHKHSRRAKGPFVAVNCGAIPESLIEATLFGHERGAFTDAKEARAGVFKAGDGGTVFLDEVGELSPQAQVKLLRVLETKEFTPVGSTKALHADVRVLAATHRNLQAMVQEGRFRQDLFYRLGAVTLEIPPLRSRPEDIGPLLELTVARFAGRSRSRPAAISSTAVEQALAHAWPGNVRELINVVERTLIVNGSDRLDTLDFGGAARTPSAATAVGPPIDVSKPLREALDPIIEGLEKRYIEQALAQNGGHLGKTADAAGIHRKSLYNKIKRYGIKGARD